MPLLSISKASKQFEVSRPTLQKALKDGTISGKKVQAGGSESWQIDTAELARVYKMRAYFHGKDGDAVKPLSMENSSESKDLAEKLAKQLESLKAEREKVESLEAELAKAHQAAATFEAVAEERKRILDEFIKQLPKPKEAKVPVKKGLWARLRGD